MQTVGGDEVAEGLVLQGWRGLQKQDRASSCRDTALCLDLAWSHEEP